MTKHNKNFKIESLPVNYRDRPAGSFSKLNTYVDGAKVITVAGEGCKDCAFATFAGGACPGAVYDRHPCIANDRTDGRDVYFRLIHYVPEKKAPPLRMNTFGSVSFKIP